MADRENDSGHLLFKWRWAVLRSELPATARQVLLTLSVHMDEDGNRARPSLTTLAKETGLGRSTVVRDLGIVENVWVRVERADDPARSRLANRYFPLIPDTPSPGHGLALVQEVDQGSPGGGPDLVHHVDTNTTSNSTKKRHVYPAEFETVWAIHHRGAKRTAFAEWKKAVPDLISQSDLETALKAYSRTLTGEFKGQHLNRWIRDERWEELQAGQPTGSGTGRLARR